MAATWSESDDSGEGDKSSSDDKLTNKFKAFGATCEENEVVGKNAIMIPEKRKSKKLL